MHLEGLAYRRCSIITHWAKSAGFRLFSQWTGKSLEESLFCTEQVEGLVTSPKGQSGSWTPVDSHPGPCEYSG